MQNDNYPKLAGLLTVWLILKLTGSHWWLEVLSLIDFLATWGQNNKLQTHNTNNSLANVSKQFHMKQMQSSMNFHLESCLHPQENVISIFTQYSMFTVL